MPIRARPMVTVVTPRSWTPVPTKVESSVKYAGARNTSPWTSFQPVGSTSSSSSSLYLAMSWDKVRMMMTPKMADRKSTVMNELIMENQWISVSDIWRYVSHRDAHAMSEVSNRTPYEKITGCFCSARFFSSDSGVASEKGFGMAEPEVETV